jgi:hypothetical protein
MNPVVESSPPELADVDADADTDADAPRRRATPDADAVGPVGRPPPGGGRAQSEPGADAGVADRVTLECDPEGSVADALAIDSEGVV